METGLSFLCMDHLHGLTGRVVGHISIAPGFKPQLGYVRRMFHISLRLITLGGRSALLAYLVHKSGRKTSTIIDPFTLTYAYQN